MMPAHKYFPDLLLMHVRTNFVCIVRLYKYPLQVFKYAARHRAVHAEPQSLLESR